MKKERITVFIDGSNLYYKLRNPEFKLGNLLKYDYAGLAHYLANGREISFKNYYVGVVRVDAKSPDRSKAEKMKNEQVVLFGHLQSKAQQFFIKRGYLMLSSGVYHEKGVDVEIAVDLVKGAFKNTYDTALLISSDTDLLPAIKVVQEEGKRVEYIGFTDMPSIALKRQADTSRLLTKTELSEFAKK